MADLRCPMCSKLNPDTLDVCQFCGARLKPLVLPPTSALQLPDDWGKPKADPAKPEPIKEADDWLASLRSNEALDQAESSAEADSGEQASGDASDWLAKLREQDAAEETAPDPYTPAIPQRTGGTDWLGSLRSKATDDLPSWMAESIEPTGEQDANLLGESQGSAPTPAAEADSNLPPSMASAPEPTTPHEPASSDDTLYVPGQGTDSAFSLPSWMTESEPEPPSTPSTVPDWMSNIGGSADETIVRRPAAQPAPEPAPKSDLPDWLSDNDRGSSLPSWMRSDAAPVSSDADDTVSIPPSDLPAWLGDSSPAQPAAPIGRMDDDSTLSMSASELPDWLKNEPGFGNAPVPAPEPVASAPEPGSGMPDWLSESTQSIPEVPATPEPGKSVVGITDWFAESGSTPPASEPSLTDWLAGSKTPAEASEPAPPGKSVVGVTDWLSSVGSQPPSTDQLEWLKSSEPSADKPARGAGNTDWLNSLEPPTAPKAGSTTDFLNSLEPPAKPGTKPLRPGSTGWLSSIQPETAPDARPTPAADIPSWLKEISPPGTSAPDASISSGSAVNQVTSWLSTLDSGPFQQPPTEDASGKAVVGTTDWFKSLSPDSSKRGQTGWLGAATGDLPPAPQPEQPTQKAIFGATDWLTELAASSPQTSAPEQPAPTPPADWFTPDSDSAGGDLPDWVKADTPPEAEKPAPPPPATSGKALIGTTDWLKSIGTDKLGAGELGQRRKNDISDLDWLQTPTAPPPARPLTDSLGTPPRAGHTAPFASPKAEGSDLPPWLAALKPEGMDVRASAPPEPPPVTAPAAPAKATEDLPDWMQSGTPSAPTEPTPALSSIDETIVQRPSQVAPDTPARPAESAPPKSVPAFTMPISAEGDELAAVRLPGWLSALRPLDARATAREPDPDREEATGPLAGMRGILPAESAISVVGLPGASVTHFVLTDAQAKLADNLRRLVQEEGGAEAEIKPRKKSRINFSFSRLAVALTILVMTLVPYVLGPLLFTPPSVTSHPLQERIDGLPTDRPVVVLMAIDYEPAYSGELNAAVQSVMVQLMSRNARVVTVSTSPAGAGIAQYLLMRSAKELDLESDAEGLQYLNLGYLPGNVAGLREFAGDPLSTITADFHGNDKPFEREVLAGFTGLGNLDMVIVATASADTMRNWIEQVQGTNMAAITSAASAPLVAPYASGGNNAQLFAMLTGLSGAIEYDQATGRNTSDAATELSAIQWSGYGLGLYAAAGIIVVGGLLSVVSLIVSRRPATTRVIETKPKAAAKPKRKAAAAPEPVQDTTGVGAFGDASTFGESDFGSTASTEDTLAAYAPDSSLETIVAPKKKTTKTSAGKKANGKGKTAAGKGAGKTKAKPELELQNETDSKPSKPKLRKV